LRTEPDAALQAVFDTGKEVGILAQQLFPGGHEIVFDYDEINANVNKTKQLIDAGVETIYEASFVHDDTLVMVDILHKGPDGWELYEVKSTTEAKPEHEDDVAVQYYVLEGSGLSVSKAFLVHLNNEYVRSGALDIQQLFTKVDLTACVVSKQGFVAQEISNLKNMLKGHEPLIDIGLHCKQPYECDFKGHCWQHIPSPSVFELTRLTWDRKFQLYGKGVVKFEDIPADYELTHAQQVQVDAVLRGVAVIDKAQIQIFLDKISWPVGFLDFETFAQAVPMFDGQRPYQQIPFQYSLHVADGGQLSHYEFLGSPGVDPRAEFADRMIHDTADCSCILVFNQSFEKGRINEMATRFPAKAPQLHGITARFIDLMTPFQSKHYYTSDMRGKHSLKLVLPALVPELSYGDLEISDGGMAMLAYAKLQTIKDPDEARQVKENLLKYCKLDTFAMVEIYRLLKAL